MYVRARGMPLFEGMITGTAGVSPSVGVMKAIIIVFLTEHYVIAQQTMFIPAFQHLNCPVLGSSCYAFMFPRSAK